MVKSNPHDRVGANRQSGRPSVDGLTPDQWLLGSAAVWSLLAVAAGVVIRDLAVWFLVWFAGVLVLVEFVPSGRLRPRSRRVVQLVVSVGYLGFLVAAYAIVQPWISS